MKIFINNLYSEILKIWHTTSCKVVTGILTLVQGFLAYVTAKQTMAVGLDAVPDEFNGLLEAMPPIEFMGFDCIMLGTIPMIVLGALWGASEYKLHCMRTTLLYFGKKKNLFCIKTIAVILLSFIITFISTVITISVTHLTFGQQGLKPLYFNSMVWNFILMSVISLTLLTVLSYFIGFLFRSSIVPMLFLVVQAYNLGNILAKKFEICKYLPVALANHLIASSETMFTLVPWQNISGLIIWCSVFAVISYIIFQKSDLKGVY